MCHVVLWGGSWGVLRVFVIESHTCAIDDVVNILSCCVRPFISTNLPNPQTPTFIIQPIHNPTIQNTTTYIIHESENPTAQRPTLTHHIAHSSLTAAQESQTHNMSTIPKYETCEHQYPSPFPTPPTTLCSVVMICHTCHYEPLDTDMLQQSLC